MAFHNEALVFHRISNTGLSADRRSMKIDRIRVYEKIAATLPISPEQRQIVHDMIAENQALSNIERMKDALEAGDYDQAVEAAKNASALQSTWKLKISLLCLRTAPGVFRRLHLTRRLLLGRRTHARGPAQITDANGPAVVSDETSVEVVSRGSN